MGFQKKDTDTGLKSRGLPDLCKEIGLSYRRLDWYLRKGYIHLDPAMPGSGFNRPLPDEREIKILKLMIRFVSAGFLPEPAALLARRMVFEEALVTTLPGGIVISLTEDPDSGRNEDEDLPSDDQGERATEEV